jgi:hypothetical protein
MFFCSCHDWRAVRHLDPAQRAFGRYAHPIMVRQSHAYRPIGAARKLLYKSGEAVQVTHPAAFGGSFYHVRRRPDLERSGSIKPKGFR